MKAILLIICLSAGVIGLKAQTLYHTTSSGGEFGGGTLNQFGILDTSLTTLKSFGYTSDQALLIDHFVLAADGKFYGTANSGGSRNVGFIFSFDPVSKTFNKLYDFFGPNGSNPTGSLVQASDGKLYGVTSLGGANNFGVIFSFDPAKHSYSKLKDFQGTDGRNGIGSLIQADDGKLYGLTRRGGASDFGVLFSFDPQPSVYTTLVEFDGINGKFPVGGLTEDDFGQLYGMTSNNRDRQGTMVIFAFNINTKHLSIVKELENEGLARR